MYSGGRITSRVLSLGLCSSLLHLMASNGFIWTYLFARSAVGTITFKTSQLLQKFFLSAASLRKINTVSQGLAYIVIWNFGNDCMELDYEYCSA